MKCITDCLFHDINEEHGVFLE